MLKYFKTLTLFVLFFLSGQSLWAKVYVISDIDDTIKKAYTANGGLPQLYHFFRKRIFPEMRDLYGELEEVYEKLGEEVEFHYVSAAPDWSFYQQKWLAKHNFPAGTDRLKRKGDGDTYTYKTNVITKILEQASPRDTIYLFGDNSSKDPIVYKEVTEKLGLVNSFIYIRDVKTEATYWSDDLPVRQLEGVTYFFSERDLVNNDGLFFLSSELIQKIEASYDDRSLVPSYTQKQLEKRLRKEWGCGLNFNCRCIAKDNAEKFWDDYHNRY